MRLGKQRPPRTRSCDSSDTNELLDGRDSSCATSNEPSRTSSMTSLETNVSDCDNEVRKNGMETRDDATVKSTRKLKPKVRSTFRAVSNIFTEFLLSIRHTADIACENLAQSCI